MIEHCELLYDEEFKYTKDEEPHVVSYETEEVATKMGRKGGEFKEVPYHTDNSEVTFILALSELDRDYDGGGTVVEMLHKRDVINLLQVNEESGARNARTCANKGRCRCLRVCPLSTKSRRALTRA